MNINWYTFYHKLGTISGTVLIIGLLMLLPFVEFNSDNTITIDNMTSMGRIVPFLVFMFVLTAFSWLMARKYKHLRNVPEITTKKESKLYSTIGISLILLFTLFLITLPLIMP